MDQVPLSIVATIVTGLCGAIGLMFHLMMRHHEDAIRDTRLERNRLIDAQRELSAALDRNTKQTAQLVTSMLFLPPAFKRTSEEILGKIDDAERHSAETRREEKA